MNDQPGKPKRKYTMSPAAHSARRANAQHSTGPVTPEGKAASSRNAYKHGLFSAGAKLVAQQWGTASMCKPCRTTCPHHPDNAATPQACSLVLDGLTKAGGDCLDKTVYLQAFDGLMAAMEQGKADPMHGMLAAEAAGAMELLVQMRQQIAECGLTIEIPMVTKEGEVVMLPAQGDLPERPAPAKVVPNPAIAHYANLLDKLGINLPNLLATPRAVAGMDQQEDSAAALAGMLGAAFQRVNGGRVIEHQGDQD